MKQIITLNGQNQRLLPQKAMLWQEQSILIVSDIHLGKVSHFRKSGIAIPNAVQKENIARLNGLLMLYKPNRVIFLGDLFHSVENREWNAFVKWMSKFDNNIRFDLVLGNHDLFEKEKYLNVGLSVFEDRLKIDPFVFTHEPLLLNEIGEQEFNICGHIHPCVRLIGKGKQSLRLPCFYFDKKQAILPAFGSFTGTYRIKPSKDSRVFAIADNQVIKIG